MSNFKVKFTQNYLPTKDAPASVATKKKEKQMKNKSILFIVVLLCFVLQTKALFGQSSIDLGVALSSGSVTMSVNGNGSSSGLSLEGTITNNTSVEISISVDLKECLYLLNSGSGQNMLATRVFLSDTDIFERFFTIPAKVSVGIVFEAYCVDLEKDNPSFLERFRIGIKPKAILTISEKINRYSKANLHIDLVRPIQLALWRAQGKTWEEIEKGFGFDIVDWEIATTIINF